MSNPLSLTERALSAFANAGNPASALPLLRAALKTSSEPDARLAWRFLAAAISSASDSEDGGEDSTLARHTAECLVLNAKSRATAAAAALLGCLVQLRFTDCAARAALQRCERAVEFTLRFCSLRPADPTGSVLAAVALGAEAAARVAVLCSAEGGGWAFLLPHALACVDCGGLAAAPRTSPLGLLHCEPCAARASLPARGPTSAVAALIADVAPAAAESARLRLAGNAAFEAGDLAAAAARFEGAATAATLASPAATPPQAHAALGNLSLVLLRQGRRDAALAAARAAAASSPAHYWRGELRLSAALTEAEAAAAPGADAPADLPSASAGLVPSNEAAAALVRAVARAALAQV